jgi:hypothetical protein
LSSHPTTCPLHFCCFNPLAVTLTEQDILTSCYGTPRLFCMRSWIALLSVGDTAFCSARHCRLRLFDSSRRLQRRGNPRVMC